MQLMRAAGAVGAVRSSSLSLSLPLDRQRHISTFGYTQAKALVYSKYGEPKDVLR